MPQLPDRWRTLVMSAGIAVVAIYVGKLAAERPTSAARLVALPLLVVAALVPAVPLLSAVAVLPFQTDVLGGAGGLAISAPDVLLAVGIAGVLLAAVGGDRVGTTATKPILPGTAVYFAAITVAWVNLPTLDGAVTIVQRLELVVGAAVVGAYLAHQRLLGRALRWYVAASLVLALAAIWTSLVLGQEADGFLRVQKNPAGQAIANALLIVVFDRTLRLRVPLGVVLTLGLVAAQSRGAIIATVVALLFVAALGASTGRLRLLAVLPVLLGVVYAAYSALPSDQQERLTNVAPGSDFATETRQNYADDAVAIFRSAPFLGTGVGLYLAGDEEDLTLTDDPHNVLLLEAAEGGVVLVGGFVVLVLSSGWVLLRRLRRHPTVPVALAVQISIVIHGFVDVYWVRGTPVMGWLLVGAALYLSQHRSDDIDDANQESPEPAGAR